MSTSPNRVLGIFFGVIYLVAGICGFFLTSSITFTGASGAFLIGLFEVNPLHNLIHVVVGVALLLAALTSARAAKPVNTGLGAIFLIVGIIGLFVASSGNPLNILALNAADNVLNFATAVVLLAVGLGADKAAPAPKTA
ncbi:MAG: conserved hypothetical rane protein [Glaciihabitans sp.]|jgi:hypothetical protein|nr:conserved hypothetical rane protein [Glaciihabitans sp.]